MEIQTVERDALLTVEQVAARLQVSPPTVYRYIGAGSLPALQPAGPGSTIRIAERELEEWLFGSREGSRE
jgi:excisionase family DNA binding protein